MRLGFYRGVGGQGQLRRLQAAGERPTAPSPAALPPRLLGAQTGMPHPTPQTEPITQSRFSCSSRVRFFPGEGKQRSRPGRNFGVCPSGFLQRRAPLQGVSGWRGAVQLASSTGGAWAPPAHTVALPAAWGALPHTGRCGVPASRRGRLLAAPPPSEPASPLIPGAGSRGRPDGGEGVPPGGLRERRRRRSSSSGHSRPRAFTSPGVKAGPLPRPLP